MSATTPPPERRTQQERRAATRQAILDAATQRLVAGGLDGVTIASVAKAAGVSTGAVTHHFDSKLDLILALTRHLSDRSKDLVVSSTVPGAPLEERVDQIVGTLVDAVTDPLVRAQFELHTAARVDPALAEQLLPLHAHSAEAYVADLVAVLLEADVAPARARAASELALCAAVGLSLLTIPGTDLAAEHRVAASLKAVVLNEIAQAQPPG